MGDVHHRSCFEKTVLFFGRALGFEHIISIFGLTEYVHHTTIEGIGMIVRSRGLGDVYKRQGGRTSATNSRRRVGAEYGRVHRNR